jgi:murein DD-endopeptidase MepM/ murein hydrolase activator NlpD
MAATRRSAISLCLAAVISCTANPAPSAAPKAKIAPVPVVVKLTPVAAKPVSAEPKNVVRPDFWLRDDLVQGGIVVAQAPSDTVSVALNGAPIPLGPDGFFLIGFDRDAENSASLVAKLKNGKTVDRYLPIRPGNWKIERVNANPTGGAKTTAEFTARRGPELARINAARGTKADSIGWRQNFIWPVKGRLSGFFGSQRIYNGSPGSYHSGLDIAVPTGTPFVAPADGVVILAAKTPFTLEGHLLMIDHGMGLNSAFLHCSELLVEEGQVVKQGQVIGKVGMTGRASGPHLHWGMKWNAARVDPLLLVAKTTP